MQDKIVLLMEETGCDRGEAELALEMCGFEVEKAVQAIGRLLKDIAVIKGKFLHADQHQFGLVLVLLNLKLKTLLRTRAVISCNPAVYSVSLDKDWFEFEKNLYGCRLWEGSLQAESQELEMRLANHYRAAASSLAFGRTDAEPVEAVTSEMSQVLKGAFLGAGAVLTLKREILDLGSFQSLRSPVGAGAAAPAKFNERALAKASAKRAGIRHDDSLVLKVSLEEDPAGIPAMKLRAGDIVSARIVDPRDIAQYLSKILGGYSDAGPQPIDVPVEAIEAAPLGDNPSGTVPPIAEVKGSRTQTASAQDASRAAEPGAPPPGMFVRVRFAVGACGDASLSVDSRLRVIRSEERSSLPWWREFFIGR